jgi:hypothetical protein
MYYDSIAANGYGCKCLTAGVAVKRKGLPSELCRVLPVRITKFQ